MNQPRLLPEDIWQALRDCISAMGGAKAVGYRMRPELGPEKAGRWLLDCCNSDRAEKLSIEQFIFLLTESRRADCHIAMAYVHEVAGYEPARPRDPAAERAQLQRTFNARAAEMRDLLRRLDALSPDYLPEDKL